MADTSKLQAPIVVIGSGPAGSAAIASLLDAGVPTLLMEAGDERANLGLTVRVRGVTVAKLRPPLKRVPRLVDVTGTGSVLFEELAPGGLSNQWSCAVPRFSEEDFADGVRAGAEYTWPIGYADLVPWYERVERELCIAGATSAVAHLPAGIVNTPWRLDAAWDAIAKSAQGCARSVTVMPYANGASTMATRSATAFNAYTQMVLPRLRAGKLEALHGVVAEELEWSPGDGRVVAVRYRSKAAGTVSRQLCSGVVVAAGAIQSPRLLLRSKSSAHPGGLGNQRGLVGRYFHDHPLAKLIVDVGHDVPIYPASYITREALDRAAPLYAAAFMQWCGTPALARTALRGRPGRARSVGFTVFGTMIPNADDRLEFSEGPQAGVRGETRMRLHYPAQVFATLEKARDELVALLERAGWEPRIRWWLTEPPGSSVHYGGTCRMHGSDTYGVTDGLGRVFGTPNVAVADSSVFTTGPEKNPVLTAMAIAARNAALLGADLLAQH